MAAAERPLWHSPRLCHTRRMPLVRTLPADHDPEVKQVATCCAATPGLLPEGVPMTMRRPSPAGGFARSDGCSTGKTGGVS